MLLVNICFLFFFCVVCPLFSLTGTGERVCGETGGSCTMYVRTEGATCDTYCGDATCLYGINDGDADDCVPPVNDLPSCFISGFIDQICSCGGFYVCILFPVHLPVHICFPLQSPPVVDTQKKTSKIFFQTDTTTRGNELPKKKPFSYSATAFKELV